MADKEIEVALVEDYFSHVGVVALKVTAEGIKVGDVLHFKGHTTDLIQEVASMEIDHQSVKEAKMGDDVGIKVNDRVRKHDKVYKVVSQD
jgi:translation initiation factor IF-2